ncbi:inositol-1-monophosphatase [Shewanella sp. 1_MG-2023]|uniref:Inositol-1-monophosphatase n=1 Tax=Shewanella electrodiphila TaxID=934143 RepID=A0ABT0KKK9_9GAMM|nr:MULTISPECIES: inositol-1-monophosphatase [Shewanella]MCC4832069.1 inositol-1-monophosphatase [Shewanella sp. 10N.7]MCL1044368.1 inositol-1-monophosphatase [Shewanella electrodiphila]MDO6611738.1 inositol-1-monophosphatase [Shewanella sp. 7_MG-2023]MDO6771593.1 inositol-1-monophosphatase [Shewanella sp. 2_MG-2023]MDO6793758.1 inositol-1-monophosphatase [Shewanella sp. 1_MG-2023]
MHPMLTIATRAARAAGQTIMRAYTELDKVEVDSKGLNDFVTSVDKEAEATITYQIRKSYPDHTIVGEEDGENRGSNKDYVWIVDPLDGTNNFVRGIPHFAVSIAVQYKGKIEVAVIYDPVREELFSAVRGQGAKVNDFRLRVTGVNELAHTMIGTGFPFKSRQHTETYMNILGEVFPVCADIRRAGSAALDLAYVAAGRLDGFFEIGLKPWDIAAGDLICREAGGTVTDFTGNHNYLTSGNVVAGSPKVTSELVKIMRPLLNDGLKR